MNIHSVMTLALSFSIFGSQICLARESVLIAAEDDWAPYSSIKSDKSGPEGLAPELVTAAFDEMGFDVEYLTVPFARCMHYAETGRTVGCFNATIVQGNRDTFHWHSTPMFTEELAIFARNEVTTDNLSLADLEGETVSLTIGYTYPTHFLKNNLINKFPVNSDDYQIRMLATGRVDYALLNTMPAYYRIHADPTFQGKIRRVGQISEDGFWVAFSKNHPDGKRMAEVFEKGLDQLHENGRYEKITHDFHLRLHAPD